jgi:uncharacterized membrane protein YecN with MAPEG domain
VNVKRFIPAIVVAVVALGMVIAGLTLWVVVIGGLCGLALIAQRVRGSRAT